MVAHVSPLQVSYIQTMINDHMSATLGGQYACQCMYGWTGHNCGQRQDWCASSPCHNGATCVSGDQGFTCHCAQGFTGHQCQEEVRHRSILVATLIVIHCRCYPVEAPMTPPLAALTSRWEKVQCTTTPCLATTSSAWSEAWQSTSPSPSSTWSLAETAASTGWRSMMVLLFRICS